MCEAYFSYGISHVHSRAVYINFVICNVFGLPFSNFIKKRGITEIGSVIDKNFYFELLLSWVWLP